MLGYIFDNYTHFTNLSGFTSSFLDTRIGLDALAALFPFFPQVTLSKEFWLLSNFNLSRGWKNLLYVRIVHHTCTKHAFGGAGNIVHENFCVGNILLEKLLNLIFAS